MTSSYPRIALDYTAAASHWPGVGRYGRELVRALVRRADCPELVLFECGSATALPATALGLERAPAGRIQRVRIRGRAKVLDLSARWLRRGIEGSLEGAELVHRAFAGRPPVRGLPQVVPLFELPGSAALPELARELAGCQRILVGSPAGQRTAAAALAPYGLRSETLRAVTTGADHWLRDFEPRTAAELAALGPPRLLALGAISRARRPRQLLRAFEALCAGRAPAERPYLHFDGRPGDDADEFQAALLASPNVQRVTWNPEPLEVELPRLVAESAVLVHLSQGELSPVTPVEALHFGTAVVASKLRAFAEVLPDEVLVVEDEAGETSPELLAQTFERALATAFEDSAREARRATAAPFTWAACAEDHLAVWRGLLSPPGNPSPEG